MRRIVCIFSVLVLLFSFSLPVFADDTSFFSIYPDESKGIGSNKNVQAQKGSERLSIMTTGSTDIVFPSVDARRLLLHGWNQATGQVLTDGFITQPTSFMMFYAPYIDSGYVRYISASGTVTTVPDNTPVYILSLTTGYLTQNQNQNYKPRIFLQTQSGDYNDIHIRGLWIVPYSVSTGTISNQLLISFNGRDWYSYYGNTSLQFYDRATYFGTGVEGVNNSYAINIFLNTNSGASSAQFIAASNDFDNFWVAGQYTNPWAYNPSGTYSFDLNNYDGTTPPGGLTDAQQVNAAKTAILAGTFQIPYVNQISLETQRDWLKNRASTYIPSGNGTVITTISGDGSPFTLTLECGTASDVCQVPFTLLPSGVGGTDEEQIAAAKASILSGLYEIPADHQTDIIAQQSWVKQYAMSLIPEGNNTQIDVTGDASPFTITLTCGTITDTCQVEYTFATGSGGFWGPLINFFNPFKVLFDIFKGIWDFFTGVYTSIQSFYNTTFVGVQDIFGSFNSAIDWVPPVVYQVLTLLPLLIYVTVCIGLIKLFLLK